MKIFFWKQCSTYNSHLTPWMLPPRKYLAQLCMHNFHSFALFYLKGNCQVFSRCWEKKKKKKTMPCTVVFSSVLEQSQGTPQFYSLSEWQDAHCRENQPRGQCEYLRNISDLRIRCLSTLWLWPVEECYSSLPLHHYITTIGSKCQWVNVKSAIFYIK